MVEDQHTSNPCTYLEVKRSKVKVTSPGDLIKAGVTGYCKEMYIASAKEQKCDAPNKENYATAITNYIGLWSSVLARERGHTVSATPGGHATC